jgi:hypothetical protein
MRTTAERHDRIVAIILALTMLVSVGATPVAAGVGSYVDLSVHYTDQEVNQTGVNESMLRLSRYDGSWTDVPGSSVIPNRKVVWGNVTDFGVIAPLAPNSSSDDNVSRVAFKYGDYGGNLNIEVNGDVRNIDQFTDIHGTTVGGASVTVTSSSVSGGQQGTVEITGSVDSFSVGGQELWIDDVEFGSASKPLAVADFATLTPYQSRYLVGEEFRSSPDDVHVVVENFTWSDGTVYGGGEARPSNTSPPMSGGSGQDVNTDNVNLRFDVAEIVNRTSQP